MASETSLSDSNVYTYHCICSTLILATPYGLSNLPTRSSGSQDQAIILPLGRQDSEPNKESGVIYAKSVLYNVAADRKSLVVSREDGFEKRTPLRCTRCKLAVAYKVEDDFQQASLGVVFLLPGGLVTTDDMKERNTPLIPAWAAEKT
jgi:hypothetical protein